MRISDWSSDVCSSDLRASEHPLALAIVDAALARDIDIPAVSDFDSPTGKGALGTVEGKRITLGNARFLDEEGVATSSLAAQADQLRADGATAIFMGLGEIDRKSTRLNSSH